MRAVLQRVKEARVKIGGEVLASIGQGLLLLLAIAKGDDHNDIRYLAKKVAQLRLFSSDGGFDLSVRDINGEVLVISQFTLMANCRKGRRPSFDQAASPQEAEAWYRAFIAELESLGIQAKQGKFQAKMEVELINDGPVTIILDSRA